MPQSELSHLELLAELDSLVDELRAWAQGAEQWAPGRACSALMRRLIERAETLRIRFEAPLVVATLGGTGTGKSSLVNALVGAEVAPTGRERPTTRRPTLVCRPGLKPETVGIDPATVELVERDLPPLRELVLLDCPDPDTTEDPDAAGTNLARLRELLPHCDVLLVTATQQKYRTARVLDELAAAAPGARLVFVQTHADVEECIRDDWREILSAEYEPGEIFFVDSLSALADSRAGIEPRGEFRRLVELLTRQLAGAAGARIRRANFLDLVEQTLSACRERVETATPAVERLLEAIEAERTRLATRLAARLRDELVRSRRQWENRLLDEVAGRWGLSPFSLVLRVYQGLGGLLSASLLFRARSPAQLALWGAVEGGRRLRSRGRRRRAESAPAQAVAWSWDQGELRAAGLVLEGYAAEAELGRDETRPDALVRQAADAGDDFVAAASGEVQSLINRQAERHTGWFTRWRYELLLGAMLGLLMYRLGRNFFYDSWLAADLVPVYGLSFFVAAAFWLAMWCVLLLWAFTARLRRGLRTEINGLAENWTSGEAVAGLFADLERQAHNAIEFRQGLQRLETLVDALKRRVGETETQLGQRIARREGRASPVEQRAAGS